MRFLQTPHNDALVIQLKAATVMVRQILVDTENFVHIITLECLKKLQYDEDLEVTKPLIVGFEGQTTYLLGTQNLSIQGRDKDDSRTLKQIFSS